MLPPITAKLHGGGPTFDNSSIYGSRAPAHRGYGKWTLDPIPVRKTETRRYRRGSAWQTLEFANRAWSPGRKVSKVCG